MACLLLLAMLAIPLRSFAQSTRGALAGNVTDTSGAVVVGAKIVAIGVDTGVQNETVSTSSGVYHFTELAIGRYNVTVTATGFNVSTEKGVLVTINSTTALNISLKPGAVTETVTIDASAPAKPRILAVRSRNSKLTICLFQWRQVLEDFVLQSPFHSWCQAPPAPAPAEGNPLAA
jgi:hypothetical protein